MTDHSNSASSQRPASSVNRSANSPASGGGAIFFFCGLVIGSAVVGMTLASRSAKEAQPEEVALLAEVPQSVKPLHPSNAPGLHNVVRLGDRIYSGSSPDGDTSFASLERLGVKTIISVDGALPDVESARRYGLSYVHLPITYGDISHETLVQLVRASQEKVGPFYIHCHHGRHRGPAAAVSLWRCLDKSVSAGRAYATLKSLGTSENYQGLYEAVQKLTVPTTEEVKAQTAALPEVTEVAPFVRTMAEIDRMWDRVSTQESDPTAISMQLTTAFDMAEQFRESARLANVDEAMKPLLDQMADELDRFAETIKSELRHPANTTASENEASTKSAGTRLESVAAINARCSECHAKYRN